MRRHHPYPLHHTHVCGLYLWDPVVGQRSYLPTVKLSAHATVQNTASRTVLTQTFANPRTARIPELRYTFPLFEGVSVVGFTCTIDKTRVIRGVVKERAEARAAFDEAVAKGKTAGLLEQLPDASDVFTTTIGNVDPGAQIVVEIVYLGELKHDAEVDGVRYTIPTSVMPRHGEFPGELLGGAKEVADTRAVGGMRIVVDVCMPAGCDVQSVQSPSHSLAVSIGKTSASASTDAPSFQKASATLSLGTTQLDKDFVLHVVASNTSNPLAILETHPTIPHQRALMATLVPKFNLPPAARPEIVFVCDRSGSMGDGNKMPNLQTALRLFLKSLPVGCKFNIVSFGSRFELLFHGGSRSYDASSLQQAERYVQGMSANLGGTEMYAPLEAVFAKRFADLPLEVFLLTDGGIWDQERLFAMVGANVAKGDARVFSLGIGRDVSHALIEGVARVGGGFAQAVGEGERMNAKVVRMLRASLTPHIKDYSLEVKYAPEQGAGEEGGDEEEFEVIEKVMDGLAIDTTSAPAAQKTAATSSSSTTTAPTPQQQKKPISLFDTSATEEPHDKATLSSPEQIHAAKFAHLPPLPTPKLLQSPWHIPALYPFSRTTVYLLLGPETCQRTPTAVVLRGTSEHGPLELAIPVSALEGTGETVHQLAARGAVRELEDGRSWAFAAKEGGPGRARGRLLKDVYPGQFGDMVQREAVRLGVQFQVAGRWCSFVAVEQRRGGRRREAESGKKGSDGDADAPPAYDDDNDGDDVEIVDGAMQDARMQPEPEPELDARAMLYQRMVPSGGQAAPVQALLPSGPTAGKAFGLGAVFGAVGGMMRRSSAGRGGGGGGGRSAKNMPFSTRSSAMAAPLAGPPPLTGGAPGGIFPSGAQQLFQQQMAMPVSAAPSMSATSGEVVEQSRDRRAAPGSPRAKKTRGGGGGDLEEERSKCSIREGAGRASPEFQSHSFTGVADKMAQDEEDDSTPGVAAGADGDVLEALVGLQAFGGEWDWSDRLAAVLGVTRQEAVEKVTAATGTQDDGTVAATACAVAFLRKRVAGRVDEWDMVVEKAVAWLEERLGGAGPVEAVLGAVGALF